jgi:hypothetical protein
VRCPGGAACCFRAARLVVFGRRVLWWRVFARRRRVPTVPPPTANTLRSGQSTRRSPSAERILPPGAAFSRHAAPGCRPTPRAEEKLARGGSSYPRREQVSPPSAQFSPATGFGRPCAARGVRISQLVSPATCGFLPPHLPGGATRGCGRGRGRDCLRPPSRPDTTAPATNNPRPPTRDQQPATTRRPRHHAAPQPRDARTTGCGRMDA